MRGLPVVISLVALAVAAPTKNNWDYFLNHKLVDITVHTEEQQRYVVDMENVGNFGLDIWLYPTFKKVGRVRIPPESSDMFLDLMKKAGITTNIRHYNLKELNEEADRQSVVPTQYSGWIEGHLMYNTYYTFTQLESAMDGIVNMMPGWKVNHLETKTWENRDIPIVEITGGSGTNKKRIFIEAGMHAREWISPHSAMYFIDRLRHKYLADNDASFMYNNFDWYVVPVANPDGYAHTHSSSKNRYWRKNRRHLMSDGCSYIYGVDLNRNWDARFGGSGSSGSCSSDTYRGPSAFSEPETEGIRRKVADIQSNIGPIDAYISIHSFSQLLLTPYAYAKGTYPSNYNSINATTWAARQAILDSDGRTYQVGTAADILYNADGSSTDWARLKAEIPYTMTYELRPSSGSLSGFALAKSEIAPCSKEVWDSIYAIVKRL